MSMSNAIIIHGMPSREEFLNPLGSRHMKHWLPWLQKELIDAGIPTELPEFPEPYDPDYGAWSALFETLTITPDTHLVGHSCGAGFLVRWLSEHAVPVGKVALVAPWVDPTHVYAQKMFGEWELDLTVAERTRGMSMFVSLDDEQDVIDTANLLREKISKLQIREFMDRGHFVHSQMGTDEFPELLDFVLGSTTRGHRD